MTFVADPNHGMPSVRESALSADLFEQGGKAEAVFHVEQGLAKLLRVHADGRETIVGLRSRGSFLGAAEALLSIPYAARAVALPRCRWVKLGAEEFRSRVRVSQALSWRVHEMQSREVYQQLVRLGELGGMQARARLWRVLQEIGAILGEEDSTGDVRLVIPLRQWEIAQLIAVTPQYLCRLISEMKSEGLLLRRDDGWTLHRRDAENLEVEEPSRLCHRPTPITRSAWTPRAAPRSCAPSVPPRAVARRSAR